jgi:hypothetical protein
MKTLHAIFLAATMLGTGAGAARAENVVLINLFEVPAGSEDAALRYWEAARDFMARQPGFVSLTGCDQFCPQLWFRGLACTKGRGKLAEGAWPGAKVCLALAREAPRGPCESVASTREASAPIFHGCVPVIHSTPPAPAPPERRDIRRQEIQGALVRPAKAQGSLARAGLRLVGRAKLLVRPQ